MPSDLGVPELGAPRPSVRKTPCPLRLQCAYDTDCSQGWASPLLTPGKETGGPAKPSAPSKHPPTLRCRSPTLLQRPGLAPPPRVLRLPRTCDTEGQSTDQIIIHRNTPQHREPPNGQRQPRGQCVRDRNAAEVLGRQSRRVKGPVRCETDRSLPLGGSGRRAGATEEPQAPRQRRAAGSGRLPRDPPAIQLHKAQQQERKKEKNVLVDVTRRGGSGGWTAGGSDEDRCRLTLSTLTEFVFHRALAEEAG